MSEVLAPYLKAVEYIRSKSGDIKPEIGVILGSGLGSLGEQIENPTIIPYNEIPGFPVSTAIGHKSRLVIGDLGGKKVVAMQGRFHFYEGYTMEQVTFPIRVLKLLGIKYLFVSNAAGGLNLSYRVGDLMVIKDQINMMPNPLIGPNADEFGPRFPDMTHPYDVELRRLARKLAGEMGIHLQEGVYIACTGPSYETRAEYKFFRTIGSDAVGMSTVPEVIVARHCDLRVFGMSVITDLAREDMPDDYVTDGEEIVKAANQATSKMTALFEKMIAAI
ncbi:MAG: purine-nucleoside phosphorylase [Bacteroidales bacterium]|nr:purine-nucleoside phosphorylase [Bacteroidales bacterium]